MTRFIDQLELWVERAELRARAETQRARALRALEEGRPWEARELGHAMLGNAPGSRAGWMILADAAEALGLPREASEALTELAKLLPLRADVWCRLGRALHELGADPGSAFERAAACEDPVEAADQARLELADRDLARGDPERAECWLDLVSLGGQTGPEVLRRRVETKIDLGDNTAAQALVDRLPPPSLLDGAGWLLRGRLGSLTALKRALLLGAPRSSAIAADCLRRSADPLLVADLSAVAERLGLLDEPHWRAALAEARGRREEALAGYLAALRTRHAPAMFHQALALAVATRNASALRELVELGQARVAPLDRGHVALAHALATEDEQARLRWLDEVVGPAQDWASDLRLAVFERWFSVRPAAWDAVLDELDSLGRALGLPGAGQAVQHLAQERERPLRVAVVGEFNTGKSTFINALLGDAVVPVGVLPTTATVNRLVWGPDRFARIVRRPRGQQPDRVVRHGDLGSVLASLDPRSVEYVSIYAPLELLRQVELVDTPGFNSPEPAHDERVRAVFSDIDAVLWLLDATQPMKDSERRVLGEIGEAGVTILALVNKIDRLPPGEVEPVLAHVADSFQRARVRLGAVPVAFSAELALRRAAGSHWPEIESLFERVLVDRAGDLKEAGLRRRIRAAAERLRRRAEERIELRQAEVDRRSELLSELGQAVARARAPGAELTAVFAAELEDWLGELERELWPALTLGPVPAARRFVMTRARELAATGLGPAIARKFVPAAPQVAEMLSDRLAAPVETAVVALAPWLWHPGAERRTEARAQLSTTLVEEAIRLAEAELGRDRAPSEEPCERRALDFARVLGRPREE